MHVILTCEVGTSAILILWLGKPKHQEAKWLASNHPTDRWWSQDLSPKVLFQRLPPKHCMLPPAGGEQQTAGARKNLEAGAQLGRGVCCMVRRLGFTLQVVWRHWRLVSKTKQNKIQSDFWKITLVGDCFGVGVKRESTGTAVGKEAPL